MHPTEYESRLSNLEHPPSRVQLSCGTAKAASVGKDVPSLHRHKVAERIQSSQINDSRQKLANQILPCVAMLASQVAPVGPGKLRLVSTAGGSELLPKKQEYTLRGHLL